MLGTSGHGRTTDDGADAGGGISRAALAGRTTDDGADDGGGISRAALAGRALVGIGGLIAGGWAVAEHADARDSARLSGRDREVFGLALMLEQLQAAFYELALRRGGLTGEPRQFAEIVGREDAEHLRYVQRALGGSTKTPRFRLERATRDNAAFIAAAVTIEQTGLAAYNGQAANLSRAGLATAARIISVEARHVAWARGLAGELPAPVAADIPISAADALRAIRPYVD